MISWAVRQGHGRAWPGRAIPTISLRWATPRVEHCSVPLALAESPSLLLAGLAMVAVVVALLSELRLSRVQHSSTSQVAVLTDEREVLRDREMLFRALVASSSDVV